MNKAQETLKKIAEALNIASEPAKPIETPQETPKEPVEPVAPVIPAEEPKAPETPPIEPVEPPAPEPLPEPVTPVEDTRVADLEKQLAEMKKILADAMKEPEAPEVPEVPVAGLTHSPEAVVSTKANGIGRKGTSIQERVHAYINGSNK